MSAARGLARRLASWLVGTFLRMRRGVEFPAGMPTFIGVPHVSRHAGSRIVIHGETTIISKPRANVAGMNHGTIIATLREGSEVLIERGCGLSGATIVAAARIHLKEGVGLGVNVCVYDNDFHSEDPAVRGRPGDGDAARRAPVTIERNAWVAANAMVLKGVRIGEASIVGAGSVVTRDVPDGMVVAGNPARVLRPVARTGTA